MPKQRLLSRLADAGQVRHLEHRSIVLRLSRGGVVAARWRLRVSPCACVHRFLGTSRPPSAARRVAAMTMGPVEIERKVRQLDNDVQSIYTMLSAIQGTQERHTNRLGELAVKVDAIDAKFDGFDARLEGVETRMTGLEAKRRRQVDTLETRTPSTGRLALLRARSTPSTAGSAPKGLECEGRHPRRQDPGRHMSGWLWTRWNGSPSCVPTRQCQLSNLIRMSAARRPHRRSRRAPSAGLVVGAARSAKSCQPPPGRCAFHR